MRHIIQKARTLGMRAAWIVLSILLVLPAAAQVPAETAAETAPADARAALIEILRDDAARESLIAELERLSQAPEAETEASPAESGARRIASATQEAAEAIAGRVAGTWRALLAAPERLDGFGARELGLLFAAVEDLLLVIAATVFTFVVLRRLARILYRRMGRRYRAAGPAARFLIFVASGLVDAAVVALAWALGYVVATTATGPFGEIAIRQTLYLNAFLAVEMVKVAIRLVISPSASDLRPLALSDAGATRLYRVLNWTVSIFGYGLLLLVPIINANASFAAGRSLAAIVGLVTALILAAAILRNRAAVAEWLMAQGRKPLPPAPDAAAQAAAPPAMPGEGEDDASPIAVERDEAGEARLVEEPKPRGVYATLARNWHWAALLWLGWLLVTMLARSEEAMYGAARLSLTLGGGIVLAIILSGALGRAVGRGVSLPVWVNERLPRLEPRLNGFVPQMLVVLRVVVVVAVLLAALWIGGAVSVRDWIATPLGFRLLGTVLSVAAILAGAFLLWLALTSWVEYRLNPDFGKVPTARDRTLLTLLQNAATIALLVITLMFALSELGLNIGPLIASAGVVGLAIGFGAQKLVQDVITGVFIQFENAMNVGDIVTAGTTTGVVEKLTIRSVSLRDLNGIYHLIPFSSVDAVSNFSRDFSNYVVDMGVAYREDTDEVKQAMFDAFDELKSHPEQGMNVIGDFEWFGLDQFADSAVILRARIRTLPGKQWGVGRAYNEIVKRIFDARGIEIPFPHTTLYWGENKKGETQPIRLRTETD